MNLVRASIERPTFIAMVTLCLVFFGLISLKRLPVDLYPEVNYPVVAVRANWNGAAPQEVEELVTKRIEDVLSTLSGVKSLSSTSREGVGFVRLEFGIGEDVRFQETQVRAKIASIRRALPDDIDEPVVFRQDPDATPILEVSLTGNRPASQLTDIAERVILTKLRQIPGVGEVELNGERTQEIEVALLQEALDAWKLNASEIVQALRQFQSNQPVGKVEGKERTWVIRAFSQASSIRQLENIPVARTAEGTPIYLRDVATIRTTFSDVRRVGQLNNGTGLFPAVLLQITKQSGENTVAISDALQRALKDLEKDLPSDCELRVTRDNADTVRSNVADVFESLLIAAVLTILVVLCFLRSPRSTLTTGLALPSSVITSFIVIYLSGFTLNVMTLLALSLAIGIVVDDAIVVRENIFRHMQMDKTTARDAAYRGTTEVALAVIATTLTLVAMFVPVSMMSTLIGQFFKPFALTVVIAMLVSLWDALTMAPLMSAYYANIADPALEWMKLGKFGSAVDNLLQRFEKSFHRLGEIYKTFLTWSLQHSWFGLVVAVFSLILAGFSIALVKKSFLPTQLGTSFSASLDGPLAVPQDRILATTKNVDDALRKIKGLDSWTLSSGSGFGGSAQINVTLRSETAIAKSESALLKLREDTRRALSQIPGYRLRLSEPADPIAAGAGGGRFQPIAINITGDNLDTLKELYNDVRAVLTSTNDVVDVSSLVEEGLPEIRFVFDPFLLGKFGIQPGLVNENMRIWVQGDSSNRLQVGDTQIPIRVRLQDGEKLSVNELRLKPVHIRNGNSREALSIPLANFTDPHATAGPATVTRENRQRILRLSAGVREGAALGEVLKRLQNRIGEIPKPLGYTVSFAGQAQQMSELFREIAIALGLGSVFVYMVLASLFESLLHPLAVMSAIPLAASGAAIALLIFGVPLDLYGGIGMILLAGIVAKNSILLVDFALKKLKEDRLPVVQAILESAPLRLRPILMTSAAMIAGMIPIAIGVGAAGSTRRSLGIATIGGVVSSTFLSLIVVPTLFLLIQRFLDYIHSKKKSQ